jgi:hypothetical protein
VKSIFIDGKEILVDAEDFKRISQHSWRLSYSQTKRAIRTQVCVQTDIDYKTVKLHRFIVNAPEDFDVDHKNGNPLDNRKENLRVCTRSSNLQNASKYQRKGGTSSRYKGVSWHKAAKKWEAGLQVDGKRKWLGLFDLEIDAAKAYNEAASQYFGEFARINNL